MLVPILYDVIKRHFENKAQYNITISELKERWTDEENYKVCRRVLEEYAVKKSDMNLNDFINSLHLNTHSKESIRAKIQNTKWLLKEGNIINTLNVSPLSNCSKAHKEQFDVARKKLNI